ncbi:MAG TPA: hypothetical protein VGU45_14105 [Microvirga sp.]|jgi:hypothetical protein|nr:hypothetical protein [Microvirga sp.]
MSTRSSPASSAEAARRGILDVDRSYAFILSAARHRRFVSFGMVADENGAPWPSVRLAIGGHLKAVCALSLSRSGPLVSSIVVNARHVSTGAMEPETRAGFLSAARDLGFHWQDGEAFLRDHQAATFGFAARADD